MLSLLQTFADQAVIAIQNARLFNETQEALERQTATADILRVISQSPDDIQPVFHAIVGTAFRLIKDDGTFLLMREGDGFRAMSIARPGRPVAGPGDELIAAGCAGQLPVAGDPRPGPCCTCPTGWRSSCRRTSSACRPATASARR